MKNKTQIFILLLIIVTFASCLYDEGPMISFRSVEKRVAQGHNLVEFTKDKVDMTQILVDSCGKQWRFLTYQEAGGGNDLILSPLQYTVLVGYYKITNDKKNIIINITAPYGADPYVGIEPFKKNVESTWKIERLTKDEMWLSCTYNNADYYLKFN